MARTVPVCILQLIFLLLLLSYATVCFAVSRSKTPTIGFAGDRLTLLSFKSLIREDPSEALASWSNESLEFCQWRGVTCGNHSHDQLTRVTALDLNSLDLVGSISPSLANLTFLQRLHLPENRLGGPIPPELGVLSHLQHLNLTSNNLRGTIPRNLSNCLQLQFIDLGMNMLEGEIPIELGSLSKLQVLILKHNSFSGSIPSEIGNLTSLTTLRLRFNNLRGAIPPPIWNLSSLVALDVQYNQLRGSLPRDIGVNLPQLQHLYANDNQLSGSLPDSWSHASNLEEIQLFDNNFTGTVPTSLGNLTALTFLNLAFNNLEGVIPTSIWNRSSLIVIDLQSNNLLGSLPQYIVSNLPNLELLSLSHNQLDGPLPDSWSDASRLKTIQLVGANLTGIIPKSFGSLRRLTVLILAGNQLEAGNAVGWSFLDALSNCTNLKFLYLSNNKLGGTLPRSIANLSATLERLSIRDNQIAGSIPEEIGNLVSLSSLDMGTNLLDGTIPLMLGSLLKLVEIYLRQNFFTGGIPETLGNLTLLNILDLSINKLQGPIPHSLGNCPLQILNLESNKLTSTIPQEILSINTLFIVVSNNLLTGFLPSEVENLKNIQGLYVSNNKLFGQIPSTIGECQVLQYLDMQGNFFEGSIPPSLGQLKGLQELDLSNNNLSGHIPSFLGSFHNLTYLNLSYNNFDGEVPKDGIFRNTSAFSVLKNNNLCGGVPELNLHPCPSQISRKKHLSVKIVEVISVVGGFFCFITISLIAALYWSHKSRSQSFVTPRFNEQHRKVSFAELLRATDGFSPANLIGIGSFGSVYKGIMNLDEYHDVAVKVLNLHQEGASRSFMAECEALKNIRHRNLVKILTSCSSVDFQGNDFKALVFEFLPNGNLDKWLHPEVDEHGILRTLGLSHRLNISIDVACALNYLHHHGSTPIVHCDLKPSNVLLDDDMVAHVSDFGLARFLKKIESESSQKSTNSITLKGSIGYAAPEYGMANKVSTFGDVYSYGILLLEMFTGKRPTNYIFNERLSLRQYVEMALPNQVLEIKEPQLLLEGEEDEAVEANPTTNEISGRALECITSVLRIGLLCSKESPKERMHMEDVTRELQKIRDAFLRSAPRQE